MDWDKLKTFYSVAKLGSFTRASEHLNLSQPAISRQIIALEDRLDTKLFQRVPKGVYLTRKGEILYEAVGRMLIEANKACELINQDSEEVQGTLQVAGAATWMSALLLENLNEFFEKHPKLKLYLKRTDFTPDFSFREVDCAILPYISNKSGLIQTYLTDFHFKLYASPEYLKQYGTPKKPEDLDNHRLITFGDYNHVFDNLNWHLTIGAAPGVVRTPFMQINSGASLCQVAEKGIGIVTLSTENPLLKGANLVEVLPDLEGPKTKVYLIYPDHFKDSKVLKAFESFLLDVVGSERWIS